MTAQPRGVVTASAPRRVGPWLWLLSFLAFVAVAHGNFETTDAGLTMYAAKNLLDRGDSGFRTAEQGASAPAEMAAARALRSGISGRVGAGDLAYTWFPIGHVWLFVPFVAAGDALAPAWPAPEGHFQQQLAREPDFAALSAIQGAPVLTQGLYSLLVPAAFAATTVLLLFHLARVLGSGVRAAAGSALAIVFATQAFALGREQLSDGPGLTFLVGALLAIVAVHQQRGSRHTSFVGGLCAGAAALLRYQNIALLLLAGVTLLLACRRQRRWQDLAAFVVGTLPAMGLFFAANEARFGSILDTGYPKTDEWLTHPLGLGVLKILFGAGRGVAWFSPLVWLVLPLALRRAQVPQLRWLGLSLFLFPLLFFARALGWDGGQCWGARYVTHGLVVWLAIVLPQAAPWRRWPKTFWLLLGLGLCVNVTSVVAPTRGVQQLGGQAAAALGLVPDLGDAHDALSSQPRFSPLLANWRYAAVAWRGGFEDEAGRVRRDGSAVSAVFGVTGTSLLQRLAPVRWEDRGGRHLWWRFWGDLFSIAGIWLLLPVLGALVWCARRTLVALGGTR